MKLKRFILKLNELKENYGDDLEVIMADNISVVNPVFSEKYPNKKKIIITDVE
ncbi:MAG: hypothetical protein ABIE43_03570 [Patescibacteria group bacterium]